MPERRQLSRRTGPDTIRQRSRACAAATTVRMTMRSAARWQTFWKNAGHADGYRRDVRSGGGGRRHQRLGGRLFLSRAKPIPRAKILILDNHDDFGGHAKRNEFRPGGRLLITNGGTLSIESPFDYSKEARGLLSELGIDPVTLEEKSEKITDRTALQGLQNGFFFDKETFGTDRLVVGMPGGRRGAAGCRADVERISRQDSAL